MQNEEDQTLTTLVDFFRTQSGISTPFTEAFLRGDNLLKIQKALTENLRLRTEDSNVPQVEFSELLLQALMAFAHQYRLAWVNEDVLKYANYVFVEQMADQNEGRYWEASFWKRWCQQGIPDPNNIPLPIPNEKPNFTVEIDSYTLSNPIAYKRIPQW